MEGASNTIPAGVPYLRHKVVDIGQHQREHKGDSKT